jgi:hypothetical protein
MMKKQKMETKTDEQLPDEGVSFPRKAIVLEDFVFQIKLSSHSASYTQVFRRKTIVNNPMLITQMLEADKPIEIIE